MSGNENGNLRDTGPRQDPPAGSPTTQQMGAVGERRRDAEEKLEHHLQEARHQDASSGDAGQEDPGEPGVVESADVAAIQNDDRLTASDRVDLIANQVVAADRDGGDRPEPPGSP